MNKKKSSVQPPAKFTGIRLHDVAAGAAGPKAVKIALGHIKDEVGVLKGMKVLKMLNQFDGFDCPGCAWPDPDEKRAFLAEYCENGAKAIAEEAYCEESRSGLFCPTFRRSSGAVVGLRIGQIWAPHPPDGAAGGRGVLPPHFLARRIPLDRAELNGLGSPNEAIFYTSGRTSNEAAFLYQLFVCLYGTNNLPDCSNMLYKL